MKRIAVRVPRIASSAAAIAAVLLALTAIGISRAGGNAIWPVFQNDTSHDGQSTVSTAANTGTVSCGPAPCTPNTKWTVGPGTINLASALDQFTNPVIDTNAFIYEVTDPGEIFQIADSGGAGGISWGPVSPFGSIGSSCTGSGAPQFCCTDVAVGACDSYDSPSVSNDSSTLYVIDQSAVGAGTACLGGPPCHGFLFAENTIDGSDKWSFDITTAGSGAGQGDRSAPVVGSDGTIYFTTFDGWLIAVTDNGGSASQKWALNLGTGSRANASPAIDANGKIFVVDDGSHVFRVTDNGASGNLDWTDGPLDTGTLAVPSIDNTNSVLYVGSTVGNMWSVGFNDSDNTTHNNVKVSASSSAHTVYSSAAIKSGGGTIYYPTFVTTNGKIRKFTVAGCPLACVFTASWSFPSGSAGAVKSSVVISANGTLYYGDEASSVHALTDNGASATENANYPFKNTLTVATTSFDSSVAIQSDGTIYAGNSSDIFFPINSNQSLPFTPTATATAPGSTPTATASPSITVTPTLTATATASLSPTNTTTATPTGTVTQTATVSPTDTATTTATITATSSNTTTATSTTTVTVSPTDTATSTSTQSPTSTVTATATLSPTTSTTPTPTATTTATPTATISPTATATRTSTVTATSSNTPPPTSTSTMSPTATISPTATVSPTSTPINTLTSVSIVQAGGITTSLIYPPTGVGYTTVESLSVTNVGPSGGNGLVIPGAITSDPEFAVTGTTCPNTLPGLPRGNSCTITVGFSPDHVGNPISATLTFFDNTAAGYTSTTMSGSGIMGLGLAPNTGLIYPSLLAGTPSTLNATVENFQTSSISLAGGISFSGPNAADFSVGPPTSGADCAGSVPAGGPTSPGKCNIGVIFKPSAPGPESATLKVTGAPPFSGGVASVGIITGATIPASVSPPISVIFGSLSVSRLQTQSKAITITNLASTPISIGPNTITSSASGSYTISGGTCAAVLAGGSSCTVDVTFAPTATGSPLTGAIGIADGPDPKSPRSIYLLGNGLP